jgi:hypothetical protein
MTFAEQQKESKVGLVAVTKTLSSNDVGMTGSHQSGILVPKTLISFFPELDELAVNPNSMLTWMDSDGGDWHVKYIHYNNIIRGGTRNEYRITRITEFLKRHGASPGLTLRIRRMDACVYQADILEEIACQDGFLRLDSAWKVIRL